MDNLSGHSDLSQTKIPIQDKTRHD